MKWIKIPVRTLIMLGITLTWLPIIIPVVLAAFMFVMSGKFLFDFLMPAELFPSIFVGVILLIWSSLKQKQHQKLIIISSITGITSLIFSQVIAEVTGLASGGITPAGWQLYLTICVYAIYPMSVVLIGIGGIKLLRKVE